VISQHSVLQAVLEDADIYGFIKAGADPSFYDAWCNQIIDFISPDISIAQLQNLIWDVAYAHTCVCTIPGSNRPFILPREDAEVILGKPDRFEVLAKEIRYIVMSF
jgi:hypothetical protein